MRDRLSELGLVSFCKTKGGKGLHVVTPLARPKKRQELNWAEAKHQHEHGEAVGQDLPRLPSERPVLDGCGASHAPGPAKVHTVPQLLKKSKAWADYCEGERSPLEAIERLGKPSLARKAA